MQDLDKEAILVNVVPAMPKVTQHKPTQPTLLLAFLSHSHSLSLFFFFFLAVSLATHESCQARDQTRSQQQPGPQKDNTGSFTRLQ